MSSERTAATWSATTLPASVQALGLNFSTPDALSYKDVAEAFVTGHAGDDGFAGLAVLLLTAGMWLWLHRLLMISLRRAAARHPSLLLLLPPSRVPSPASAGRSRPPFSRLLLPFVLEWSLLVWPVLWSMTLGADWAAELLAAQVAACAAIALGHRAAFAEWPISFAAFRPTAPTLGASHAPALGPSSSSSSSASAAKTRQVVVASEGAVLRRLNDPPKLFISNYRASLMIYTSIAILAVDFIVFPRRFCKSETFGIGMMDGGVGSFIISHAITSIHARGGGSRGKGTNGGGGASRTSSSPNMLAQLWHVVRAILPLLVLGVARLFTIRAVEYQQHVSEYGVHWNFFFTLAAVALLSASLSSAIESRTAARFGLGLLLAYQFCLSTTGLTEYLMHAPRVSLLSANKEGVLSSVGYFSLYLVAVRFGSEMLAREKSMQAWGRKFATLLCVDLVLWSLAVASSAWVQPSSRRMVNLTYGLWMLASNLMQLLQCMALDIIVRTPASASASTDTNSTARDEALAKHGDEDLGRAIAPTASSPSPSLIIEAVNKNSLPFFLLCNLCTGAINLSMYTIFASNGVAMAVLSAYTFVTCLVAVYIDHRGWIIKL